MENANPVTIFIYIIAYICFAQKVQDSRVLSQKLHKESIGILYLDVFHFQSQQWPWFVEKWVILPRKLQVADVFINLIWKHCIHTQKYIIWGSNSRLIA